MNKVKVISVTADSIIFEGNIVLTSNHDTDCCESHYLDMEHLSLEDFKGLEFNLTSEDFFSRIDDYGIALNPISGHPVKIPGYGFNNNGDYSSHLDLILSGPDIYKKFDISECQDISE